MREILFQNPDLCKEILKIIANIFVFFLFHNSGTKWQNRILFGH